MKKRIASSLAVLVCAISLSAQWANQESIPAYHDAPPKPAVKLPPILKPAEVQVEPGPYAAATKKSYQIAAKNSKTMYQMPCYCHCDRGFGHASLRSCFEDQHGANCGVCMKEAYYVDQQLAKGKTAKQIRDGINAGEWQSIDLIKAAEVASMK